MKLVMTLLVRDEADVLRANFEHHLAQGVDFFVVTDNCSLDDTAAIVGEYVQRGLAELIEEPDDSFQQAAWVTRMARRAAVQHAADWVIHSDTDEFWISCRPGETLRQAIEAAPPTCRQLQAQRWNAVIERQVDAAAATIRLDQVRWFDAQACNGLGNPLPPKVMHRADAQVEVAQGNHGVTMADPGVPDGQERLLILHFPYRGRDQYTNKIRNGGRAYLSHPFATTAGLTWRIDYRHYMAGRLAAICHWRLPDAERCALERAAGRYREPPNPISAPSVPAVSVSVSPMEEPQSDGGDSLGIVTLADDNYFCGTRLLTLSCGGRLPIVVYDLGLGEAARAWIDAHEGISLRPIPDTPLIRAIRDATPEDSRSRPSGIRREWPLWICPSLIEDAPWKRVFWIDSDIVLLRDLEEMIERLERGVFVVEENLAPDACDNSDELYDLLPIGHPLHAGNRLPLNAGLTGWDLERDAHLLAAYQFPIRQIFQTGNLPRSAMRWWDQGCLIWALQQAGYCDAMLQNRRWNLCVVHSALKDLTVAADADDATLYEWIDRARQLETEAAVVHWNGYHPVPWKA